MPPFTQFQRHCPRDCEDMGLVSDSGGLLPLFGFLPGSLGKYVAAQGAYYLLSNCTSQHGIISKTLVKELMYG